VNSAVVVTFNKPLSTTASLGNVIALTSASGPTSGSVSLTAPNVLTFTPSSLLANNTSYTVTVNGAVSFGGNIQTVRFSSTFVAPETTAPVLQISSPANGTYINTATPTVSILISDQLTGINLASARLILDGQLVTASVGSTFMSFTPATPLGSGAHTLVASVQNNAGIVGTLSASFIVDTAPPTTATLTGISAGQVLKGQVSISASATDSVSGIARINLLVDGNVQATLLPPPFSLALNTVALSDGPHNFTVQAVNNAGTSGTVSAANPGLCGKRAAFSFDQLTAKWRSV